MANFSVSGIQAYQSKQYTPPVKRDDGADNKPPVKEKESQPPEQNHPHAKKKHKVDFKA